MSGLYHQILLSLQKVLADPVRPLCSHYGAVVGLHALGWKVSGVRGGGRSAAPPWPLPLERTPRLPLSLQAVERVLYPHLSTYWANLQAVLDDYSVSNAQVKADGHKVYGAILVSGPGALGNRPSVTRGFPPRARGAASLPRWLSSGC